MLHVLFVFCLVERYSQQIHTKDRYVCEFFGVDCFALSRIALRCVVELRCIIV